MLITREIQTLDATKRSQKIVIVVHDCRLVLFYDAGLAQHVLMHSTKYQLCRGIGLSVNN